MLYVISLLLVIWVFFRLYTMKQIFSDYDLLITGIYSVIGSILLCGLVVNMSDIPWILSLILWICCVGMGIVGAWGILIHIEYWIKDKKDEEHVSVFVDRIMRQDKDGTWHRL